MAYVLTCVQAEVYSFQWAKLFCILFRSEIWVWLLPTKRKDPVPQWNLHWIILELKSTVPDFQGVRRSQFFACFFCDKVLMDEIPGNSLHKELLTPGNLRFELAPKKNDGLKMTFPSEMAFFLGVTVIWMFPKIVVFPPKSSILIGFSNINHPFWGTPIFGNTHLFWAVVFLSKNQCLKAFCFTFLSTTKALTAHVWLGFC